MAFLKLTLVFLITQFVCAYCDDDEEFTSRYPVVRDGELCSEWQRCIPPYFCDLGYAASGANKVGRCRLPPSTGQRCTDICQAPAKCISSYCSVEVPIGGVCNDERVSTCIAPSQCRGPPLKRRCENTLPDGARCDENYRACQNSSRCVEYGQTRRCVSLVPIDGNCGNPLSVCDNGGACVTSAGRSTCRPTLDKGQVCNPPNAICKQGLICAQGTCKSLVGLYAGCSDGETVCEDGLECRGNGGNSYCVRSSNTCNATSTLYTGSTTTKVNTTEYLPIAKPLPRRGELCNALDSTCDSSHVCLGNGPLAKCYFVQKPYGFCTGEYVVCTDGWQCRGPKTSRICVQSVGIGKGCDNAYFFCEPDLQCIKWGNQRRCVKFVPADQKCEHTFELCDTGYKCTNTDTGMKCLTNVPTLPDAQLPGANEPCKLPQQWCKSKHVCVGPSEQTKCLGALREGQSCEIPNRVCQSGTVCRGNAGSRVCRRAMRRGKGCNDKDYVCETGLTCMLWGRGDRCVAFRNKGGDCSGSHTLCGPGLSCRKNSDGLTRSCQ